MNYIIKNIDNAVLRAFKARCAVEGKTMRETLITFMAGYGDLKRLDRARNLADDLAHAQAAAQEAK